ncbi:MAG: HypC/HybG/HupF family hydrogenase formation chaperone [Rhodoferax sp.]|nr:HypC/HybG/HupF family hydrogenase formation chaperone [Rhodoferax sp.]
MCLAIPAQVLELRAPDMAVVDLAGVRKEISVALLDTVAPGDYVIVHVGFALSKLDPEEAANTLALFADFNLSGSLTNSANCDEIH